MGKIIIGTVSGVILLFGFIIGIMSFSYNNQHKDYHTRYDAELQKVDICVDNMWKIIADKFQIADEYAIQFKAIAKINVDAFKPDGEAWKWINTTMPQINPSFYKDVMASIEAQRMRLEQAQKNIIDVVREHNNIIIKVPSSWFISDKSPIEYQVISSKEAKVIMLTGEDERSINDLRKNK